MLREPPSDAEASMTVEATEYVVEIEGDGGLRETEANETVEDTGVADATPSDVVMVVETVLGLAFADLSFAAAVVFATFSVGDPKFTRLAAAALAKY